MLDDKAITEFKEIFEKHYKVRLSDTDARESAENLLKLTEIIVEISAKELRRKEKLKSYPKGFHLDPSEGTYSCIICSRPISGDETWWDENGTKCLDCQYNLDYGFISNAICKDRNSYFRSWKLKSDFGLHPATVKKYCRLGKLVGIDLKTRSGAVYDTIFMVKDNLDFLNSLKSQNPD